ncbi:hypothetical protein [Streptomyces sp. PanSC9]|uniref:hypothetical protein n=1 Tax=Streptomyces sp. PanSC9 TaxID=1520461 RepID=UPI0021A6E2D2|nr:hypothetical protein [Streptomyces sp. PanSC9]
MHYGSAAMRLHVMLLDRDPRVSALAARPLELRWPVPSEMRTHAPQLMLRLADGQGVLADCRGSPAERPPPARPHAPACFAAGPPQQPTADAETALLSSPVVHQPPHPLPAVADPHPPHRHHAGSQAGRGVVGLVAA